MNRSGLKKQVHIISLRNARSYFLMSLALVAIFRCGSPAWGISENDAGQLINRPVQITSRTEGVLDMAVSADGKHIVYISGDEKPSTLWLASADPEAILLPEKLQGGTSVKSSPAISTDSRYVAYVDTDFDVKGDIYLIDRFTESEEAPGPVRLTGRETEDGGPYFSQDGRFLYFHQSKANTPRGLVMLDLKKGNYQPLPINTGGNAMFCSLSPDNRKLAFVSTRDDTSGDIFVLDTVSQTVVQVTSGPAIDMFPMWHENSQLIYFSRIGSDTNYDGKLTPDDHSTICRIQADSDISIPFPVTPLDQVSFKPYAAAERIYFLSSLAGVSNCWAVAEEGYIRTQTTAEKQLKTAEIISNRIPHDPYKTLLAYVRVIEKFPNQASECAKAGYLAAGIFQDLRLPASAAGAYQFVRTRYADVLPESGLALIRMAGIEYEQFMDSATRAAEKKAVLKKSLALLDDTASKYPGIIASEAQLERIHLLLSAGADLSVLSEALNLLENILSAEMADDSQKARALLLKARIYDITADGRQVIATLRAIITDYPNERRQVDHAVDQIITRTLSGLAHTDTDEKIRRLNLLAIENQKAAPPLSMGAFNRIGDLYYETGDLIQAKAAYENVLASFSALTTQTAAARLSLAEILFREERFRAAIDLYEEEISLRNAEDRIYQLARMGYIRKNISAGEFYFRLGEIPSARSLFKELIDYDDRIIEAHRGYIKCAAAAGDILAVLAHYRNRLQSDTADSVWLYCTGLCLTYLNTEDAAEEARSLIKRSIRYDSSVEYFHQTLGYVYEVLETVYGKSRQLERALMSYQKAYFLNNHDKNPENAANLELNIGNIYYLLGQYGKSLEFYSRRQNRDIEFSTPEAEIVFYKRYGESAFQNNDIPRAITAFLIASQRIDDHIDPLSSSRAFDKLKRYIKEMITVPAGANESTREFSETVARRQSRQNLSVAHLTAEAAPPPSSKWQSYKRNMLELIDEQESVNKAAARLAGKYNDALENIPGSSPIENAAENLANLTRSARQALQFPERLTELKAEILDRLGLAYQENGDWKNAMETFEQVYFLNEKSGNGVNLARNRRSVAYNTYQLAVRATGEQRIRLLENASAHFKNVLSLIDLYGVPAPVEKEKKALLDISVSTSLNKATATQAAGGFSKSQEKRIAETFISRIQLELGNLRTARESLEKQLKRYPDPEKIKEEDVYGVSLLYHRAGLLDNGEGNFSGAFDKFSFSANLCMKLKNPVSTALNIFNMASAGQKLMDESSVRRLPVQQIIRFQSLDKQATELLSGSKDITGASLLMQYHNRVGVFYFSLSNQFNAGPVSVENAVLKIDLQQQAVSHFNRGLTLFKTGRATDSRDDIRTAAALYLNMAAAANVFGDRQSASRHFQSALSWSETGVFPDLKWRALAGLGRTREALAVLETVPITSAGCLPGEIIRSFAPLVFEKLNQNTPDAALGLAEKISELERFNRTAPYVRPHDNREKAFFEALYPRLEKIQSLENEYSIAAEDIRPFIARRLENEKTLLSEQMGSNNENLPPMLKDIRDKKIRDLAIRLMALAQTIESTADELARVNIRMNEEINDTPENRGRAERLSDIYQKQVRKYRQICEAAYYDRPVPAPPDFITLLAPEPFDIMNLSGIMTDDDAVARIFHTNEADDPYAVFLVTKEETTAFTAVDLATVKAGIKETIDWTTPYIACETPMALNFEHHYPFALSLKHLERCINNRNPFKQRLIVIPPMQFSEKVTEVYNIKSYAWGNAVDPENFLALFPDVNTLLIANGPASSATVPTEPGSVCRQFFAISPDTDRRLALEKILARSGNVSLAVVNSENADHLYLTGHLFSIYGCPSVIYVSQAEAHVPLAAETLSAYVGMSGIDALQTAAEALDISNIALSANPETDKTDPGRVLYLGYQGMNRKESAEFAKSNFIGYVKNGRTAFDKGEYATAAVMFENAIAVAGEISAYDQYLPDLYKYARESAYLADNMDQALFFARELADLYHDIAPSTEAHAEALYRLGLMYAKKDNYEKAIPVIEQAVKDMSQMPPDEVLIRAMMDLGIVLENATNYETALSRFKSAADLSRTLKRSELIGEQYLNIGRVYDLRLNQYATAIQYYEKALDIYSDAEDSEKMAESSLDIGRCRRLLGNFSEADRLFEKSLELIAGQSTEQMLLKVKILIEQANNAWFQGRYQEAFKFQRQCYKIAEAKQFSLMQVISMNTEGLIWWSLGDYEKAIEILTNALAATENLNIRKDEVASTLNNIGLIQRDMGNYEQAMETFDRAVSIDTEINSKWGLAYDYRNKGLAYMKLQQPEQAADLFDRAYDISNAIGNQINAAKAILGKGDALFALNDFPEAEKAYQTALRLSESMLIRETQWRALFGLARIQITYSKDPDAAEILLRQSVEIIEQLRSDIKIKQLKENFITNKLSVYETLVQLLADMGKPSESFEIAERSRARNFIDLLGGQKIGFATAEDEQLYKKQQIIKSEIEATERLAAMADSESERRLYTKTIQDLQHDLENVMIDMQLQNPQLASMVSVPPVKTENLIGYLESETVLISYYLLENEIFCWILRSAPEIGKDRLKLIRIPAARKALDQKILDYRRIIQNLEPYETHAQELYALLIGPLAPYLTGAETIGICPHSSLHYLSFGTLLDAKSFLLEKYSLFYVPSAAVLEYTLSRRVARPYGSPRVLAVGNPDLGDPILDLPFAEKEVGSIKWNFPEITILTRETATENWVVSHISDFDIIHIASHGEFDPVSPLMSAIKLAGPDDKTFTKSEFDGNLEAGEIFGLNINADMVFLSACQTGLGKISAGDDVVGLNRSFFYAGTHTVISSLWRVSDVSTAILIKTFYRLYMNQDKADCLRQAAMHVKSRYPHPGYWGAFTLVGDYY